MNLFKRLSLLLAVMALVSTGGGCSFFTPYKTPKTQGTIIDVEAVSILQKGLTMAQVTQLLGPPFGKDSFNPSHWEYVFYTTDKSFHPGAIKHLSLDFDKERYLKDWEIIGAKKNLGE